MTALGNPFLQHKHMPIHNAMRISNFARIGLNLGHWNSYFLHIFEPHTAALHSMTSLETQMLRYSMTGHVLSLSLSHSLWSPHSWTDTCLFQLYLSTLTDNFQTVRNSMFLPIGLLWCKKPGSSGRSQKNKHANSVHFNIIINWSSDAPLNPFWCQTYSMITLFPTGMQEWHILFSAITSQHTGCTVWLSHNHALYSCNHVYVL